MSRYGTVVGVVVMGFLLGVVAVPNASATLIGTVLDNPGVTVVPGLVPPGASTGTLLASLSVPFVTTLGTTSGTLTSAVYREAGGTLDFYYQVGNNARSVDAIARETDTTFSGFQTSLGFRTDGGSFGGPFVSGTVVPVTGDRNSTGDVVGFSFNPPDSAKIQPGQVSTVLVISTNATNFTAGDASLIDGGVTTVASFEPASAVPEPGSMLLLGTGVLGLVSLRRRTRR